MTHHPLVNTLRDLLEERGVWYERFEHEPVRTSEEAARVRPGYAINQGAKALIARARQGGLQQFVMFVVPGDRRFNTKTIKRTIGLSDIRFATEAEVAQITRGVRPGGVPPFGNLFGLKVYVDPSLCEHEKIVFNAGDRSVSLAMRSADYCALVDPTIVDIT